MTTSALNGLARASRDGKRLTFLNAANWNVSDEARSGVSTDKLFQIFRHLDDALANWLLFPAAHGSEKPAGDIGLRDCVRLDNADY